MTKYFSPKIEIEQFETHDVMLNSPVGVEITALEGVDTGDSKTAVFDASHFF